MASTIFDVTPETLERSASTIEAKANEFATTYKSIYTAVSDLNVSYKGEASQTFNQRIQNYQNDFTAAKKLWTIMWLSSGNMPAICAAVKTI